MNDNEKRFFEFISSVVKRPAMFWVNEVSDINRIIFGYEAGSKDMAVTNIMVRFTDFANIHFESKEIFHWTKLIQLYSGGAMHSIDLFVQVFGQFVEKNYNCSFPIISREITSSNDVN